MQLGRFVPIESSTKTMLELPGIAGCVSKGKSIPKALLDAGTYVVNNKININSLPLCSGSGLTLTKNEIKDIIEVIKYLENRGILLKRSYQKN